MNGTFFGTLNGFRRKSCRISQEINIKLISIRNNLHCRELLEVEPDRIQTTNFLNYVKDKNIILMIINILQ